MAATPGHPEVGAFGGKLLRAFGENVGDEVFKEVVRSDRIDSVGLNPHRNHTVTDRGAGELDEGQYKKQEKVFGISGALALFRASALEDIRFGDEVLDHDFLPTKKTSIWRGVFSIPAGTRSMSRAQSRITIEACMVLKRAGSGSVFETVARSPCFVIFSQRATTGSCC